MNLFKKFRINFRNVTKITDTTYVGNFQNIIYQKYDIFVGGVGKFLNFFAF